MGREGISVNNSDSLHNTGPQESVMYLMYKNRLPLLLLYTTKLGRHPGGPQVCLYDKGPYQVAAKPPSPRNSPAIPPSLSDSWAISNPIPQTTDLQGFLARSFCICPFLTPR